MPPIKGKVRKQQIYKAREAMLANKRQRVDENVDLPSDTGDMPSVTGVSASRRKIEMMAENLSPYEKNKAQVWFLAHVSQLTRLLQDILCPECSGTGLTISICEKENFGFSSKMKLECTACGYANCEYSSPRVGDSASKNVAFEINPKMVLYSHEIGKSHTALQTFGTIIGMPAMHLTTFQDHDRRLSAIEADAGEEQLQRAATAIRNAYADLDQDLRDAMDHGENPIIDIAVSFDGTWQKRGFTSLYGVGVCIDVLTGLVIDYHVRSKYCHACSLKESSSPPLPPAEMAQWKAAHAPDCCINHTTSSKSMEQEAAKILWLRSVDKFSLRYTQMLSDGDSSAYKAVCDAKPYGDDAIIDKLECINHVHKRMGTALRKLAKEQRLGGTGQGRLTQEKCNNLQNFYRGAILDNLPHTDKMRNAVWAGLYHSMSTDEEPHHRQCPQGENSWCWYQVALARGEEPGSHKNHPSHTALSLTVAHKLIPIYKRMSEQALLLRMTHGGTQNTNECINATIWVRCPKTSFMGRHRVLGSVARAVCAFNEGATHIMNVMNNLHLDIANITIDQLQKVDQRRIVQADAAHRKEARERRRVCATHQRTRICAEERQDGDTYAAGGH